MRRKRTYARGRKSSYGRKKNWKRSYKKRRGKPQYVKVSRGGIRL